MEIWIAFAALLLVAPRPTPQDLGAGYGALVERFATAPDDAVTAMLALPPADLAAAVRGAARTDSGWTAEALERALLMHGDAAIVLTREHDARAASQMRLADDLAFAVARHTGSIWFAHQCR